MGAVKSIIISTVIQYITVIISKFKATTTVLSQGLTNIRTEDV